MFLLLLFVVNKATLLLTLFKQTIVVLVVALVVPPNAVVRGYIILNGCNNGGHKTKREKMAGEGARGEKKINQNFGGSEKVCVLDAIVWKIDDQTQPRTLFFTGATNQSPPTTINDNSNICSANKASQQEEPKPGMDHK